MSEGLGDGGPYDRIFEPWAEVSLKQVFVDAVLLRLMGALHYLVLSDTAAALAELYPPEVHAPNPKALAAAMAGAAESHRAIVESFMALPPQTNEVARSLCLVGGFLTAAAETGLPLRCLELGASAGLNMNWDRFGYRFSDTTSWGDPHSPLQLFGEWSGGVPPRPQIEVIERLGCDQNPIDVRDEDLALRLQSYVWADQADRLDRLRRAIALKRETGGAPMRADAADWMEAHSDPAPGSATIIYHSVFIQYPPAETQARILAAIAAGGALASRTAPFGWLRMEPAQKVAGPMEVRLTLWPGGEERLLARVHPHGASVDWLASPCG